MGPKKRTSWESQMLEGRYANYFKIGYNAFEFVIEFGQYYSENEEAELYSRIITSPTYAKELLRILADSVSQYKKKYENDL